MRGTLHSPQRYLEGYLKTLGGGGRNNVRGRSGERVSNEFDGPTHHIGDTRSKARMRFFVVSLSECLAAMEPFCFDASRGGFPKTLGERSNSIPPWRPGLVGYARPVLKRLRYKVEFGRIGFVSCSTPAAKGASW